MSASRSVDDQLKAKTQTPTSKQEPKRRNPVERAIVWGLIVVLLAFAGVEGAARWGYSRTIGNIEAAVAQSETAKGQPVTMEQVEQLVAGFPQKSIVRGDFESTVTYRWPSLAKKYGAHVVYQLKSGNVRDFYTDEAPAEEPLTAPPSSSVDQEEPANDPESTMPSSPPLNEPARGEPMRTDADGDGPISREETP